MDFANTNPGQVWKRVDYQQKFYCLKNLTDSTNKEKNSEYSHCSALTSIQLFSHHFEMEHHKMQLYFRVLMTFIMKILNDRGKFNFDLWTYPKHPSLGLWGGGLTANLDCPKTMRCSALDKSDPYKSNLGSAVVMKRLVKCCIP